MLSNAGLQLTPVSDPIQAELARCSGRAEPTRAADSKR